MSWNGCIRQCLASRWSVAFPGVLGVVLIAVGLLLQMIEGVVPCPMCIMQRLVWIAIMGVSAVGVAWYGPQRVVAFHALNGLLAIGGAYVAARQSWLQWYPPEFASCGRDFYGIVDTFPLRQALPMLLRGSGDCSAVDWTFLGGSIANWSFVMFALVVIFSAWRVMSGKRAHVDASRQQV
jgi:disulfide bond formation protein DsbB